MSAPPSRIMKIIDSEHLVATPPPITMPVLHWHKCIICQENSDKTLITPTDTGYQSLNRDLLEYAKYETIPRHLQSENILQDFIDNKAKYHKSCRSKYNAQKISRAKEKFSASEIPSTSKPFLRSKTQEHIETDSIKCIFCDEPQKNKENLVSASTLTLGPNILRHAILLNDEKLLKKLHSTDLVAIEAKYHKSCYKELLNKVRSINRQQSSAKLESSAETTFGSVFSDIVTHIQETYLSSSEAPVFRLASLTTLLSDRMSQLGFPDFNVNRTRFKQQILDFIPGIREDKVGKEVFLTFEEDIRNAVEGACYYSAMSDGMCLARAARIIRKKIIENNEEFPKFEGSFQRTFTSQNSVPKECVLFCRMLLEGTCIDEIDYEMTDDECMEGGISNIALNLAQLLRFNCKNKKTQNLNLRHKVDRETPLPLYIGLKLYNDNASVEIIDKLCELGLSVSYKRVLQVSEMVASSVCDQYLEQGFVCPPNLEKHVFTCAAIDNIDHNTSSNTSLDSFHGTSISLILHPDDNDYTSQPVKMAKKDKYDISLPDSFTSIPPTPKQQSEVPMQSVNYTLIGNDTLKPIAETKEWLDYTKEALKTDQECLPWIPYHARKDNPEIKKVKCVSAILPLLKDSINSHAMVRHTMDIIITAITHINPGQTPVITADLPVYAIAKQIQWTYPEMYGEEKLVVMLGPLHIEMAVISMIGSWLQNSGWTENLIEAGITTTGRAEGILKSAHVKRSRSAHEVSLVALNILQEEAYHAHDDSQTETLPQWIDHMKEKSPSFKYWCTTMELESLLLTFVKSIRQGDIGDFITCLDSICPWMFSLDRVNYSRWLPVFVHDLKKLPLSHPKVYKEFLKGNFTSLKTNRSCSRMGHDQVHEQNNKLIKNDSRTLCNLTNDSAVQKWSVSGPEMVRMTLEYETMTSYKKSTSSPTNHSEDKKALRQRLFKQGNDLVSVFREHGNPFQDIEVTTVHNTRIVMNDKAQSSVFQIETRGQEQYMEYLRDRLILRSKSIHSVIKRNNLLIYGTPKDVIKSKDKQKIGDLRKDCNLFCKLYVASQGRNGDIDDFFTHENHPYAPSISEFGRLRKPTNKSDIVKCIEDCTKQTTHIVSIPEASCFIIDGAALVHMLVPKPNQTFEQYIENVFVPFIKAKLRIFTRVDVVFDQYTEDSLKLDTRESRGSGNLIAVKQNVKIPKNFQKFLAHDKNKEQLFILIAQRLVKIQEEGKTVICTCKDKVLSSTSVTMPSSTHEEADARLLLHTADAVKHGHHRIIIKTVDSDVLVIAIYGFTNIQTLQELWIEYGTGKNLKYLPVHIFCAELPSGMPELMPFFHAFTGCDTVSAFFGIGKKTSWKTWASSREVDAAFHAYSCEAVPCQDNAIFALIESFVVHMYYPASDTNNIHVARRILFTKKNKAIENIPPTRDALIQHIKRAILQTKTWRSCLLDNPQHLDPCNWGWQKKEDGPAYTPVWKTIPDASMSCKELVSCKCKERCSRCRCVKNDLNCTLLCACEGACSRA